MNNILISYSEPVRDTESNAGGRAGVPEAFEVQPENLRQLVDHQLLLSLRQDDGFGGEATALC